MQIMLWCFLAFTPALFPPPSSFFCASVTAIGRSYSNWMELHGGGLEEALLEHTRRMAAARQWSPQRRRDPDEGVPRGCLIWFRWLCTCVHAVRSGLLLPPICLFVYLPCPSFYFVHHGDPDQLLLLRELQKVICFLER